MLYHFHDWILDSEIELPAKFIETLPQKILILLRGDSFRHFRLESYKGIIPRITEHKLYSFALNNLIIAFGYNLKYEDGVYVCEFSVLEHDKININSHLIYSYVNSPAELMNIDRLNELVRIYIPKKIILKCFVNYSDNKCNKCDEYNIQLNKAHSTCTNVLCSNFVCLNFSNVDIYPSDVILDDIQSIENKIMSNSIMNNDSIRMCIKCNSCKICIKRLIANKPRCYNHNTCNHNNKQVKSSLRKLLK